MAFLFACGKFLGFAQLSSRIRIRVEAAEYSSRNHRFIWKEVSSDLHSRFPHNQITT